MMKGKTTFINGIIFFFAGLFLYLNPDMLVKFISYFIGGVLIAVGIYKTVNYYIQDKRLGVVNQNELGFGVTMIILGILLVCLAGTIEFLTRIIIGGWLIIAGITRIANTFYTTNRDNKFYALLIVGFILIVGGLYTIINANLPFQILGLFMIIYGIIDFISYFTYGNNKKEIESKKSTIEEAEIIEAENDENKK